MAECARRGEVRISELFSTQVKGRGTYCLNQKRSSTISVDDREEGVRREYFYGKYGYEEFGGGTVALSVFDGTLGNNAKLGAADESMIDMAQIRERKNRGSRMIGVPFNEVIWQEQAAVQEWQERQREKYLAQIGREIEQIIRDDEFVDGEFSRAELYMDAAYKQSRTKIVLEAVEQVYLANFSDGHMLEGVLTMVSSLPYDVVAPQGPTIALALLNHKLLIVRDRAIQCFEKWNSKQGLKVLRNLDCHPAWLQAYVEKVIKYIEAEGSD